MRLFWLVIVLNQTRNTQKHPTLLHVLMSTARLWIVKVSSFPATSYNLYNTSPFHFESAVWSIHLRSSRTCGSLDLHNHYVWGQHYLLLLQSLLLQMHREIYREKLDGSIKCLGTLYWIAFKMAILLMVVQAHLELSNCTSFCLTSYVDFPHKIVTLLWMKQIWRRVLLLQKCWNIQ